MRNRLLHILSGLLLLSLFDLHGQELKPRIAGMEHDSTYMALLHKEYLLSRQLDSLEGATFEARQRFREEPQQRDEHTATILSLESQSMALQSEKRTLDNRLKTLEHDWLLKHWEQPTASQPDEEKEENRNYEAEPQKRYLTANACFRGELPASDYALLCQMQEQERDAAQCIEQYAENYALLLEKQQQHLLATEQGEADALYDQMDSLLMANNTLDSRLRELWEPIFDHKSYAYAYLLDRLNCDLLLESQIERLNEAQREADAKEGEFASDALVDYFIEKRALVSCEMEVASACQLFSARDSLQQEADYLASVEFRLPRISPERRHLLDYASIEFPKKVSYTTYTIPACTVYETGTIYRIRLMDSRYRQQANIFRGVEPLYLLQEGGRYIYFTGGFASLTEARLGCEQLTAKGFKMPVVVRWVDGKREEVSAEESDTTFRIEISGTDLLSDEVRELIREAAPGREISRMGSTFRIGGLPDPTTAEDLARKIRLKEGALTVKVVEEN